MAKFKVKSFYHRFELYIANTSWILAEKILHMGVSFLVTILVSRYLGPEKFGVLAYAVSLIGLFSAAGHMGLSGLVVREVVKHPENRSEILGTSFALKSLGIFMGFVIIILIALFTEEPDSLDFWVLAIVALSILFTPFDIIIFWFEAHLQVKYAAISRTGGILVSNCFKIALVFEGAKLLPFAFANLLQAGTVALLLVWLYQWKSNLPIQSWSVSFSKAKELLREGSVIYLGSIFAVVYLKVDQVMLKWLIGSEEVGIYNVAATLSEVWYFVPIAIVASFFPRLIQLRQLDPNCYKIRLQQLFDLLLVLSFVVAICVTFLAKPIINVTFGLAYLNSVGILSIHIWAALFIFMRAAFSKWILIENALVFSLITQGFGGVSNVILNLILIPRFGGLGASFATLISYAVASYLSLVFYKKTRLVFWMMTRSLLLLPTLGFRYWNRANLKI